MKKVKITVLKTTFDEELAKEYGAEGLTACPMHKVGQVFFADYAKPDGFCDEAWKAIYQYVFALSHVKAVLNSSTKAESLSHVRAIPDSPAEVESSSHNAGSGLFYYGDWIRIPGVAICSCNDGLRPVIFKLEVTDEESRIGYEPVR